MDTFCFLSLEEPHYMKPFYQWTIPCEPVMTAGREADCLVPTLYLICRLTGADRLKMSASSFFLMKENVNNDSFYSIYNET